MSAVELDDLSYAIAPCGGEEPVIHAPAIAVVIMFLLDTEPAYNWGSIL